MLRRRAFLAMAAGLPTLAACSGGDDPAPEKDSAVRAERFSYGDDPSQYADLYRPTGDSRGVVVVIHGGFWKALYDASLGRPLALDLARRGWTAWNLEYRRVGNGGGRPETFDDVAAGIDKLADVPGLDRSAVVALGHSAGGHLAAWSAARGRFPRFDPVRVPVTAVVSQAGVLDLVQAYEEGLGGGAVEAFLGAVPGPEYRRWDPQQQLPLDVPVRCVHATDDTVVPVSQSQGYVDAAVAAGADATLEEVDGGHMTLIEAGSPVWDRTVELLDGL